MQEEINKDNNSKENKLNKSFIIIYIINIVQIIITFYFWVLHPGETFVATIIYNIIAVITLFIAIILTCVSVILGIINFVKKKDKKLRYKVIIMLLILV